MQERGLILPRHTHVLFTQVCVYVFICLSSHTPAPLFVLQDSMLAGTKGAKGQDKSLLQQQDSMPHNSLIKAGYLERRDSLGLLDSPRGQGKGPQGQGLHAAKLEKLTDGSSE